MPKQQAARKLLESRTGDTTPVPLILRDADPHLDRGAKPARYESAGVLEYWIVDPEEKTLCQHTLAEARYSERLLASGEVRSVAFPGLSFDLASIF